jgi:hypothetical protein
LQGVADTLGVTVDFESKFVEVMQFNDGVVEYYLNALLNLPDDSGEKTIQGALLGLITSVAMALDVTTASETDSRMAVGGILAEHKYDIRGETDICVRNTEGKCLLVIEVKTRKAFNVEENWYRKSRAAQVITALYHFNGPTILATDHHWKLFHENEERDAVFTFPTARHVGFQQPSDFLTSLQMHVIGSDFIKMLIICLSARPAAATIYTERNLTVPNNTSIDVNKHPDSAKKPPREEPPAKKPRKGDTETIPTYETTNERMRSIECL